MTIALSPHRLTAPERLDEIAEILATGALRHMSRKTVKDRDIPVGFVSQRSVYDGATNRRVPRQ
jgi:hypothetical protein